MTLKFNEILSERLEGENLSALSKKLGLSKSLLHDWMKSSRTPSLKNIDAIQTLASYLGLSLEEILIGQKEQSKTLSSVLFEDEGRKYLVKIEKLK